MIQKFYLKPWSSSSKQLQWFAIGVGFIWFFMTIPLVLFSFVTDEYSLFVTLPCAFSAVPMVAVLFWLSGRYKDMETKSFRATLPAAAQAIGQILDEKVIPYKGQYHEAQLTTPTYTLLQLNQDNLTIKIIEHGIPPNMRVQVQIRPITVPNRPLVKSLQQKIDRALLPPGLE